MDMLNQSNGAPAQFHVTGPFRHSNGDFKFHVTVMVPSPIIGGVPDVVALSDIHVRSAKACAALAAALNQIAQQLPADLVS